MATSLEGQIRHFVGSNHQNIVALSSAISANNWGAVRSVVDRVSNLEVTASIANLINSSTAAFEDFVARLKAKFPPDAIKIVFGGVLGGVGGAALTEAAGLAIALGISVVSVEIIAIAMLLWGISMALPAIWRMAHEKLAQMDGNFVAE
ncbi:hypothetical protein Q4S45_00685 [Massilia sp. R2A-15]|uniref:hypothetical protein n=1 Tax=Massilia sp. R2A-15 TaxID=3064278 RepID=UPI0027357644|nr:hypothetical protein [Massilia sp. R2A-15]WLI89667.1 hypothetical protein Q4S45_00685 [Massilia sp. R2A-15]